MHLRDITAWFGAQNLVAGFWETFGIGVFPVAVTIVFRQDTPAIVILDIFPAHNPGQANGIQSFTDINIRFRVGVGTGGVIDEDGTFIIF